VSDRVKPSFVIFDIRALMLGQITNDELTRLALDALQLYPFDNSGRQKDNV